MTDRSSSDGLRRILSDRLGRVPKGTVRLVEWGDVGSVVLDNTRTHMRLQRLELTRHAKIPSSVVDVCCIFEPGHLVVHPGAPKIIHQEGQQSICHTWGM